MIYKTRKKEAYLFLCFITTKILHLSVEREGKSCFHDETQIKTKDLQSVDPDKACIV